MPSLISLYAIFNSNYCVCSSPPLGAVRRNNPRPHLYTLFWDYSNFLLSYSPKLPKLFLLTPWSRVLLEKLTGFAASQEIPRFYGTPKFITVLTSTRHLSLSWARSIQSPQPPPTSWRSILILSSHLRLGLPSGLVSSGFPTKTLCTTLPSPITQAVLLIIFCLKF
jgi:hypothetical protein